MRVYWSDEASRRLREITTYIAQDSPTAAHRVAALLLSRSRTLAQPPLLGRRLPEYPGIDLREVLERPYRLIYAVTAQGIEIVTLMHYRQVLPEDPNALRGGLDR
ncbi:MAG: type II toxin-antitoxin system RelE/ParE family toxin [Dokdonella sp.]